MTKANSSGKQAVLGEMMERKVSAIIRTADRALAADAMQSVVEGGFRLIEFTLTTPDALELVAQFAGNADLLVGAGTVMSPKEARDAVSAGARFIVSPVCDAEVVAEANRLDVVSIPGTYTPTEMMAAVRCGADLLKLFPAPPGGPVYARQILGPFPHLRIFPTAGVTPENFIDFLDAGCVGVGFTVSLFDPEDMANRDFEAIRSRAAGIIERLSGWQREKRRADG